MATDQHSTSRRAVIKALAAAPIIATASVVEAAAIGGALTDGSSAMNVEAKVFDISPPVRWNAVIQEYRRLYLEWAAHPYGRTQPDAPDYDRLQEEEAIIADRAHRALDVVLSTAVPNFEAFIEKLEIFEREFEHETDGRMSHLVSDARRLA